jgi:hypothetical protein
MTPETPVSEQPLQLDLTTLDLASQVGKDIIIHSEQFHGKPLKSRITATHENSFAIDRGGSGGMVDNLVHNQIVTAQIEYKGEPLALRAQLKRNQGGKCILILQNKVIPLARRRFMRIQSNGVARLAVCPTVNFDPSRMNRLRWLETPAENVSSGGARISLPNTIEARTFLFINLMVEELELPALLMGVVRHCHRLGNGSYSIGIEFIVREERHHHFSATLTRRLPQAVFQYSSVDRDMENQRLITWMNSNKTME